MRDPLMGLRAPPELRKQFVRLCEANRSSASAEIRAFMERTLEAGKLDPERLDAIAKEQAKA